MKKTVSTSNEITLEERIARLEAENEELREILKKVAGVAVMAYKGWEYGSKSTVVDEALEFANRK